MDSPGTEMVLGIPVKHAPCADCGDRITEGELSAIVRAYLSVTRICSICGKPIRLASISGVRHHHASPKHPKNTWDLDGWDEEPHFSYTTRRREWSLDMDVHLSCGRQAFPAGNWAGEWTDAVVSSVRKVENLEIESPCPKCGTVITPKERDQALRWLFRSQRDTCVICTGEFRIHTATVGHRHYFKDQDCKIWSVPDWKVEESVWWQVHWTEGTSIRMEGMRAHWSCARRVLRFAHWDPPLSRRPWQKQDWSTRIEPWYFGRILGEAAPDWGQMMTPEEARRRWREE